MEALKALVADATLPKRHVAALRRVLADMELSASGGKSLQAYREALEAAGDDLLAPKHVRARWAALRDLPRDELREGLFALAAELKRDDVLGVRWHAVLNDYTAIARLGTGAYDPTQRPDARRARLRELVGASADGGAARAAIARRCDALVKKLLGLLEMAEYEALAFAPDVAEALRDDLRFLVELRAGPKAAP